MNDMYLNLLIAFVLSYLLTYSFSIVLIKKGSNYTSNDKPELEGFHATKEKIPNVGGIAFISATIITFFLFSNKNEQSLYIILFITCYSILGFIDDNYKRFSNNGDGIKSLTKLIWQFTISSFFVIFGTSKGYISTGVPFFMKEGIFYKILENITIIFFFAYFTNAFNITDGLDGLLAKVSLPICFLLIIISIFGKNSNLSVILSVILFAALLAFLHFNKYPAKYFMGDCGSMALGCALLLITLTLKQPIVFLISTLMISIELMSSLIQIIAIRIFHKKVFSIAPLHHLYEKNGKNEIEIVNMFSKISALFSIIALIIYLY